MWIDPLGLKRKCHFSGDKGRAKAKHDIERNGFTIVHEEVTMKVNGSRMRADFVALDGHGNYHVFEAKHGNNSRLTENQEAANIFNINSPSNNVRGIGGGKIMPNDGNKGQFEIATNNRQIVNKIGTRGSLKNATFHILVYQ